MAIIILAYFCFVLSGISTCLAERAATWDYCDCRWDYWSAWSQCSKTCGGGISNRDRSVWHKDIPECDGFEKCATPESGRQSKTCNTQCYNGGSFHRYIFGFFAFCQCPKGVKGSCCEQIVTCGKPSTISHGVVTGNIFTYNKQVQYTCNDKYNMTDPSLASRTCTENGYWSGRAPVCLYAVSCESSPCKNAGACVNLLGDYRCDCLDGWSGKNCDIDIQPPIITGCPADIDVFTSNMTSLQNWIEPNITDPHGKNLHITKNYEKSSFEFPWGEFTVQYNAVKPSNGLSAECVFNITVKPHPCKKLLAPTNGAIVCNGWRKDYVQICIYLCSTGYSLPPGHKQGDFYNCGATGQWLPNNPVQQCISNDLFSQTAPTVSNRFSFKKCRGPSANADIRQFYINTLMKSQFNDICITHPGECEQNNVDILC